MAFCTNCGAPTNARFCEKCGSPMGEAAAPAAPSAPAPVPAPGPAPLSQPGPTASVPLPVGVKKKTSPFVWILGGCGVLVVVIALIFVGTGLFVAKKVSDAGLNSESMKKNPALAAARMAVALNPDVEVVNVDEDRGVLTIKEKKSGKVIRMNAEDIKNGKISFSDESTGEKMSIGVDANAKLPDWVPSYPGSKPEGAFAATGGEGEGGMVHFKTNDAGAKVLAYYQDALKQAGYRITTTMSGDAESGSGGMVAAENKATRKSVMVTLSTSSEGTDVAVTYGSKK